MSDPDIKRPVLTRLHHVGIAVADLDESIEIYQAALGAELMHRAVNEKEGLEAAFLRTGEGEVELMSATRAESPVGKFLAKRGPGLHHVAYGVSDIGKALADARAAGLELIDSEPRMGMHGYLIAFVHPGALGGVLTEFVET
ncbi:MAG TPA: methylmalonyl-CoA epimerase [Candidatus Dormibacteraeota bacterium]|jgi:methylmalonyl-CoA epimerase